MYTGLSMIRRKPRLSMKNTANINTTNPPDSQLAVAIGVGQKRQNRPTPNLWCSPCYASWSTKLEAPEKHEDSEYQAAPGTMNMVITGAKWLDTPVQGVDGSSKKSQTSNHPGDIPSVTKRDEVAHQTERHRDSGSDHNRPEATAQVTKSALLVPT